MGFFSKGDSNLAKGYNENSIRDLQRRIESVYMNCGGKTDEEMPGGQTGEKLDAFKRQELKILSKLKEATSVSAPEGEKISHLSIQPGEWDFSVGLFGTWTSL